MRDLVGAASARFAGMETTDLAAVELHARLAEEVVREGEGGGGEVAKEGEGKGCLFGVCGDV